MDAVGFKSVNQVKRVRTTVRGLRAEAAGREGFATYARRELCEAVAANADRRHRVGAFDGEETGCAKGSLDGYIIDYNHVFLHRLIFGERVPFRALLQKQTRVLTSQATCVSIRDV